MKRTLASLGALGALLTGGVAAAALAGGSISLTSTGPVPQSATLLTGEVLTFQNADTGTVTVSSKGGGLKETAIPPGGTLTTSFTAPGNFRFRAAGRVVYQGNLSVIVTGGGSGLTLAPTKSTVRYGAPFALQGRVPIPGQLVRLQSHLRGKSAWKDLTAPLTSAPDGSFTYTPPRPTASMVYRAVTADGKYASPQQPVEVQPVVKLTTPARRTKTGRTVTLRFRMVPYLAAPNASLEAYRSGRYRRVQLRRVRRQAGTMVGIATFTAQVAKGTNRFRVLPTGRSGEGFFALKTTIPVKVVGLGDPPPKPKPEKKNKRGKRSS